MSLLRCLARFEAQQCALARILEHALSCESMAACQENSAHEQLHPTDALATHWLCTWLCSFRVHLLMRSVANVYSAGHTFDRAAACRVLACCLQVSAFMYGSGYAPTQIGPVLAVLTVANWCAFDRTLQGAALAALCAASAPASEILLNRFFGLWHYPAGDVFGVVSWCAAPHLAACRRPCFLWPSDQPVKQHVQHTRWHLRCKALHVTGAAHLSALKGVAAS